MTPERLAEIRALVASWPDGWADAYMSTRWARDLLAAYDAIANGSAVREARARERDAVRRAGDAEERAEWLGRMLNAAAAERDEARAERAAERDGAAEMVNDARRERDEARAALAAERTARGRSEHAWADERDAMKAERDAWREQAKRAEAQASDYYDALRSATQRESRSAKGVPASEIATNVVPSQPGAIAKLTAPSIEERVATLEADVRGLARRMRGAP